MEYHFKQCKEICTPFVHPHTSTSSLVYPFSSTYLHTPHTPPHTSPHIPTPTHTSTHLHIPPHTTSSLIHPHRLGEAVPGPPVPWWGHQSCGTKPVLSGRSSVSHHSAEVARWEGQPGDLGYTDRLSGEYWTWHSSQRSEKGAGAMKDGGPSRNRCVVSSVWVFKCDCQYMWGHSLKDVLTAVTSGNSTLLIVIYSLLG